MNDSRFRGALRCAPHAAVALAGVLMACSDSLALSPTRDDLERTVNEMVSALAGAKLFVSGDSPATRQASEWNSNRPSDAALMHRIASQPVAKWLGAWSGDVRAAVHSYSSAAAATGRVPVFVAYNITNRDCGSHSAGGAGSSSNYRAWIRSLAAGITGRAVVVLEPDAVPQMDCLSPGLQQERIDLLRDAISVLRGAGATVYLDAGNARWHSAGEIASRLKRAGIDQAHGFSLNVSNFLPTDENVRYGTAVSGMVGGKHFIIDTSRNGVGATADAQWCNPRGRALGAPPTTETGNRLVDGLLWIKQPGESDGTCNGGPPAGQWWSDYALELARNQPQAYASASGA
jgi:endoglucanase